MMPLRPSCSASRYGVQLSTTSRAISDVRSCCRSQYLKSYSAVARSLFTVHSAIGTRASYVVPHQSINQSINQSTNQSINHRLVKRHTSAESTPNARPKNEPPTRLRPKLFRKSNSRSSAVFPALPGPARPSIELRSVFHLSVLDNTALVPVCCANKHECVRTS